jgi:hypothetical protein
VQPLKVLQVAVEEWILVVPLDFERDDAAIGEGTDMIDLMGDRLLWTPLMRFSIVKLTLCQPSSAKARRRR